MADNIDDNNHQLHQPSKNAIVGLIAAIVIVTAIVVIGVTSRWGATDPNTSNSDTTGSSTSESSDTINFMLDWTPNTNHIGLYVAQKLGYYKNAGINITILPTSQAGAENAVETGVADVGFTTLSNVAAFDSQGEHLQMVFDLTQKPVARWCSLASRKDITTPKDFDGKTFVSFGSAEQTAVVKQMIKTAGGTGDFSSATVGTSTFQTLSAGKGDFGGFYATWEEVESELDGPALNCFSASDWGVPGNPDQLGFAVNTNWEKSASNRALLQKFITATIKGYQYALANPDKASDILVSQAASANLDPALVKASMKAIIGNQYWGEVSGTSDSGDSSTFGTTDTGAGQEYLDFLADNDVYKDDYRPNAAKLATNDFISASTDTSTTTDTAQK